jgi:hypothetical protein
MTTQHHTMAPGERVRAALAGEPVDRVPLILTLFSPLRYTSIKPLLSNCFCSLTYSKLICCYNDELIP